MQSNFKKVHTGKDLTISSAVLVIGIGLFFANKWLGVFIMVCGLLTLLLFKKGFRKEGQTSVLSRVSMDISKTCSLSVIGFLRGEDRSLVIKEGNEGGSMRLITYFNKQDHIAYVQLFNYSNYLYEAATEDVELTGARADEFIGKLFVK